MPVSFSLHYTIDKKAVTYDAEISGQNGRFSFLTEEFKIGDDMNILRNADTVTCRIDKKLLGQLEKEVLNKQLETYMKYYKRAAIDKISKQQIVSIPHDKSILRYASYPNQIPAKNMDFGSISFPEGNDELWFISSTLKTKDQQNAIQFMDLYAHSEQKTLCL